MRIPLALEPLLEAGVIEDVVRPLMSGKEAQLYIVRAGGEERVAKVYKASTERSFKRRADYIEGRRVRNSRDRRAMAKRSRHGKEQDEAAWRAAEVDIIYRLSAAGVRVPKPYNFMEGVLVMELVTGEDGQPAPRLGDVSFTGDGAREAFDQVIEQVVRMLCAGIVHADLSEFNILMSAEGPVVIDFPQAVDAASNTSARRLLLRDVGNVHRFLSGNGRQARPPYAEEMWQLFERNELTPDARLRGRFRGQRPQPPSEPNRRSRGPAPSRGGRAPEVEVLVRSAGGRIRTVQPGAAPSARPEGAKQAEPSAKRRRRRRRRSSKGPASGSGKPAS